MTELPSSQSVAVSQTPLRILLLDDEPANLFLRAIFLRQHGYDVLPVGTMDEAISAFPGIDIAVLDYHLGEGKFGTDVAATLRQARPEVPIIILSASLEYRFGGEEDMHLLKGYSSNENLVTALRSFEAKRRGDPVVVDAREFFYSRIALAIGTDVIIQILDGTGKWVYCNEAAADYLGHERSWFPNRSLFEELPGLFRDWHQVISDVAHTRQTYVDRSRRGLLASPGPSELSDAWSVLAFPMTLHDGRGGVVLTARTIARTGGFPA